MPATQHGQPYRLGPNRWGLRYYDANGDRRRKSPFPSKSAALAWYRDVIEPQLRGEHPAAAESTLAEFVEVYLERHAVGVRARTITTLRDRLHHATRAFGDVPLRELEHMTDEIAAWQAQLPERAGHGITSALRQTLDAAVRWKRMRTNPAKLAGRNPKPPVRTVRAYTRGEVDAIALELSPMYEPLPAFASATGLRPEEWAALERSDLDRPGGVLHVRRTISRARSSSSARRAPAAGRCRCRLGLLPRWTRSLHGSTRGCCSPLPAGS
jgi:integrase